MKRLLLTFAALALLLGPVASRAQGTPGNAAGLWGQDSVSGQPCIIAPAGGSTTCKLPANVSVTASISPFASTGAAAQYSSTTSSATGSLPSGTAFAFTNTGANPVIFNFSAGAGSVSAATAQFAVQAGGCINVATSLSNINYLSTGGNSTLNVVPGTGLLAGSCGGGGGGGGGGGAVTIADSADVTLGAKADVSSPCTVSSPTSCTAQQQYARMTQLLNSILTAAGNPIPAGSNAIGTVGVTSLPGSPMQATGGTVGLVAGSAVAGKFGIDQTTPGTTNGVAATNFPATVDTNAGATSASTIRVRHASDDSVAATSSILTADVTPTLSASTTYAAGKGIGGVMQFTSMPTSGLITQSQVSLASGAFAGSVDLLLFKAALTGGTTGDNTTIAIAAADLPNLIGVIHLADSTSLGGAVTLLEAQSVGQPYVLASGSTIYAVAIARSASLVNVGAGDAIFKLRVVK